MTKLNYKREFTSLTIAELKAVLTTYDPSVDQVPLKSKKTVKFAVESLFIKLHILTIQVLPEVYIYELKMSKLWHFSSMLF